MRSLAAAVILLLAQDSPPEVLVGTLQRDAETGALSVNGTPVSIAASVAAHAPLVGKRVQIVGRRPAEGAPIDATIVNQLEPEERDLQLRVAATAEWGDAAEGDVVRLEVLEYSPNAQHRHPGTCKSHAWVRARADGKAAQACADAEFRVPAYVGKADVKVFVRATAPRCAPRDSGEFGWSGKRWIDGDLDDVEGARKIELALRAAP